MSPLTVKYLGQKVGRLAETAAGIVFEYDPAFIAAGHELSPFNLPLRSGVQARGGDKPPAISSTADILAAHDQSVAKMKETMGQLGDAGMMKSWKATAGEQTLFEMPKAALIRSIALNHWYHHRGQLSVYLRLLDVPVPSIYGPSADENPFAAGA